MADPGTISVPNVVNLTQSAAETTLKDAGLLVGIVTTASSATTPVGSVSGSDPAAGAPVNQGSAVNMQVSSGPAQVVLPDVGGLTRAAAEVILKNAGLRVGAVKTQRSDSVPDGGIIGSVPEAGALVSPASAVELDLSSGPEPNWTQYIPTGLFSILGIIVLGVIVFSVTRNGQVFVGKLADKDIARGLITFLIAITTVGIAIILAISTLVLTEGDAGDKRFDRGKQVLSVLIGVLGTIVGFYFGSSPDVKQKPASEQVQTAAPTITTTALPDGAANKGYPPTTLQTAGLVAPLKWSVTPDLPHGLDFDLTTGAISGTPTTTMKKSTFTFTVTDSAATPATIAADLTLEIK